MTLLDDLNEASGVTSKVPRCPLCDFINAQEDPDTRAALVGAAAGTIGVQKLARIMRDHASGVGRRTIERHRTEEHTP